MSIILFTVFLGAILVGVPVTFSLGIASAVAIAFSHLSFMALPQRIVPAIFDASALTSIPIFILAGHLMSHGGMGHRLVRFANVLVGRTRGGLASANVLSCMFFGGISGSATADTSAIGSVMIPAMEKEGYDKEFATAVTVIASPLGVIVPPSIIMIVYCWVTNTSIATIFAAGYAPGCLVAISLMITAWIISVRKGYPTAPRHSAREVLAIFIDAFPGLLMPVMILGGIVSGIFTATEAAAVATVYGFVICKFWYKDLDWKDLPGVFTEAAKLTGIVAFILALAGIFGWLMAYDRVPFKIADLINGWHLSPTTFLVCYVAFLMFLGLFLSPTEGVIIAVPIFYPVAQQMGIDPLHFGILTVVTKSLGHVTPPVGLCIFIGSAISKLPVERVIKSLIPFYLVALADVLLVAFIPAISTFVPHYLGMSSF
jgi:tripartite ATP-independent transporter DctM subunit